MINIKKNKLNILYFDRILAYDSGKCKGDNNPRKSSGIIRTTITCLIVFTGVFILLYIGSHFIVTKQQPTYMFQQQFQ